MGWKRYAASVLVFSVVGFLLLYLLQRIQGWLPGGPEGMGNVEPDLAFNTAVSFVTNTNWQAYGGETTMKYVTQMVGLTVQNFVSAGHRHSGGDRAHPRLLPPLDRPAGQLLGRPDPRRALRVAAARPSCSPSCWCRKGWCRLWSRRRRPRLRAGRTRLPTARRSPLRPSPSGPAASQVAIKQLGTNGGGFFNANSAHPFENPTPLSNFLELVAILLIPAALCYTFGRMVGNTRQGWVVLAVMMIMLVAMMAVAYHFEQQGVPQVQSAQLGGEGPGPAAAERRSAAT